MDDDKDLDKYENLLKTFESWPAESPVFIKDLAEAGFCYTGKGDLVYCRQCKLLLGDWKEDDSPLERHKDGNNTCPYFETRERLRKAIQKPSQSGYRPVSNPGSCEETPTVGLKSSESRASYVIASHEIVSHQGSRSGIALETEIKPNIISQQPRSKEKVDIPKLIIPEHKYNPTPQNRQFTNHNNSSSPLIQQNAARIGEVSPNIRPSSTSPRLPTRSAPSSHSPLFNPQQQLKNTDLTHTINRLHTFLTWPQDTYIQPLELAEAGFYYLGMGDGVKCHRCSIALRNWDFDDNAWGEHIKWSPNCPFVQEYQANQNAVRQTQAKNAINPVQTPLSAASYALPVEGVFHNSRSIPELMSLSSQPNSLSSPPSPLPHNMSNHRLNNEPLQQMSQSSEQITGHNYAAHQRSPQIQNYTRFSQPEFPSQYTQQQSLEFDITELLTQADIDNLLDAGFNLETIIDVQKAGYQKYQNYFRSVETIADAIMHYLEHGNLDNHSVNPSTPVELPAHYQQNSNEGESQPHATSSTSSEEQHHVGDDTTDLQRELERVKEMQTCKICMDQQVGVVFLPCGHLLACPTCSTGMEQCPLCRAQIQSSSRIYLS